MLECQMSDSESCASSTSSSMMISSSSEESSANLSPGSISSCSSTSSNCSFSSTTSVSGKDTNNKVNLFDPWEIWTPNENHYNDIFMQRPNFLGPKYLGAKFLGYQFSWGPNFLGTKKVKGPNEIGDHFSYSLCKPFTYSSSSWELGNYQLKKLTSRCIFLFMVLSFRLHWNFRKWFSWRWKQPWSRSLLYHYRGP